MYEAKLSKHTLYLAAMLPHEGGDFMNPFDYVTIYYNKMSVSV